MKNADPKAIFDYIFNLTVPGIKLELSRVVDFMEILGNPYKAYKVIHIAGTNGKGSTSAMLAAILDAYGHKTGLYTSPHLIKPNERVRIGSQLIPDEFIVEKVASWRPHIDELGITFFEVLTALAMVYFKEQEVEYAVLETGLGGRLDATNVVDPILSVITAISMDHENILGDTLEKIAREKAGIIKPGKPLILGKNESSIHQLMRSVCEKNHSPILPVEDLVQIKNISQLETGQRVDLRAQDRQLTVNLPLQGRHQVENFSIVLVTLIQMGLDLDQEKIQNGLNAMHWPGRMQLIQENPKVLYDVAHNLGGLERLLESLREISYDDAILLVAFNARKNISEMLKVLEDWSGPVLFTSFEGYSALDIRILVQYGIDPERILPSVEDGYLKAVEIQTYPDQVICYLGSHYLAESLFDYFGIVRQVDQSIQN